MIKNMTGYTMEEQLVIAGIEYKKITTDIFTDFIFMYKDYNVLLEQTFNPAYSATASCVPDFSHYLFEG